MRKSSFILMLCIGGTLIGCSSKPDVSDIESQLKEGWGTCQGLKMTNLKKTNGVDHGKIYEMTVSYELVVTKDATATEAWEQEAICPSTGASGGMHRLLWAYGKLDQKWGKPLKVGDIINVNDTFNMIKSEKGWIIQ